jgi:hypothetical protein
MDQESKPKPGTFSTLTPEQRAEYQRRATEQRRLNKEKRLSEAEKRRKKAAEQAIRQPKAKKPPKESGLQSAESVAKRNASHHQSARAKNLKGRDFEWKSTKAATLSDMLKEAIDSGSVHDSMQFLEYAWKHGVIPTKIVDPAGKIVKDNDTGRDLIVFEKIEDPKQRLVACQMWQDRLLGRAAQSVELKGDENKPNIFIQNVLNDLRGAYESVNADTRRVIGPAPASIIDLPGASVALSQDRGHRPQVGDSQPSVAPSVAGEGEQGRFAPAGDRARVPSEPGLGRQSSGVDVREDGLHAGRLGSDGDAEHRSDGDVAFSGPADPEAD